jgi:hypothetical protein
MSYPFHKFQRVNKHVHLGAVDYPTIVSVDSVQIIQNMNQHMTSIAGYFCLLHYKLTLASKLFFTPSQAFRTK